MKRSFFILACFLLQLNIKAHGASCNIAKTDSLVKHTEQNKPQTDLSGIEFVDISGVINKEGDKFVLHSKDKKTFRLNCKPDYCNKYLGQPVTVHGILMQGCDNPKYGSQNLPISQIDPGDIINVITSVSIELSRVKQNGQ